MPSESASQTIATPSRSGVDEIPRGQKSTTFWYREAPEAEKHGPFSLEAVTKWYESNRILPHAEFSTDGGRSWSSIVSLRLRNGPAFPFCSLEDISKPAKGSIEMAREMISLARSEVDRLEEEMESAMKQLEEEEEVLAILRKMDMVLEGSSSFSDTQPELDCVNGPEEKMPSLDKVNPLDLIHPVPAPIDQDAETVIAASTELRILFLNRNHEQFRAIGKIFVGQLHICLLCNSTIKNISLLIRHTWHPNHLKMMIDRNLVFPEEPLAFWMRTLQDMQIVHPHVEPAPFDESKCLFTRVDVMHVGDTVTNALQNEVSFNPLFFCPEAFRQCSTEQSTQLNHIERIGPLPKVGREEVMLEGPLAILAPCDDMTRRVTTDPATTLLSLAQFRNIKCRWLAIFRATETLHLQLRPDYDAFDHSPPVWCKLCEDPISSTCALIKHIISLKHMTQVTALGTSVDAEAFSFWRDAINSGIEKDEDKIGFPKPPRTGDLPLPLTVLQYTTNVSDPCMDLEAYLMRMQKQVMLVAFSNDEQPRWKRSKVYLDRMQLFTPFVTCQMCDKTLFKPEFLITHISSKAHIDKACEQGGTASMAALQFWQSLVQAITAPGRTKPTVNKSFGTEEPQEEGEAEAAQLLSRDEVVRIREYMELSLQSTNTREVFRPRFFCARGFQSMANDDSTPLHQMNRVCAGGVTEIRLPILLEGPLAILARCDDPARKITEDPKIALKRFGRMHSCNRLTVASKDIDNMLLERSARNYNEYNSPSSLKCAMCESAMSNIGSSWSLLIHITSSQHIAKIEKLRTSIDQEAYSYWEERINSSYIPGKWAPEKEEQFD